MAIDYWLEKIHIEKTRHLEDVTLVFPSYLTCISGENGTGKSTILALIACMHSRKSEGHRDNEHFFFKDGEYYTMSTFMKKTIHDRFSDEWKVHYTVLTHSEDGRERDDGKRVLERSSRYQSNYGWRFENKKRFRRPLYYWRWKDNIPSLENPSIPKRLKSVDLVSNQEWIRDLQTSLRYVFDDHAINIDTFAATDSNPFNAVFRWIDHSTYNTASGKDKATRLLALLHRIKEESIVLIDEYEIGLHPKIQISLLNEIRRIAERKKLQIIFTTHSRDVVAATEPHERIHLKNINGAIWVYPGATEQFIFSDLSHEKFEIFCEDEVARLWLEEIMKICGRRDLLNNISFLPVGSYTEVINHSKATFRNDKFFIAVLDGDVRVGNKIEPIVRPNAFYQKIEDKERDELRYMFETNVLYLPGVIPPEKLFFEKLRYSEPYKERFKEDFDVENDMIELVVDRLSHLDDHHKYYETVAKILNESEERVIRWSIKALLRTDPDIKDHCSEYIVKPISELLQITGRREDER